MSKASKRASGVVDSQEKADPGSQQEIASMPDGGSPDKDNDDPPAEQLDSKLNADATPLEIKLIQENLINDYILKPSDVTRTWKATRMKDELIEFF